MNAVFSKRFFVLILFFLPILYADCSYADNSDATTDIGTHASVDINDSLRAAIIDGNIEKARHFIENGADVNKTYADGSTPLLDVIEKSNGSSDMVNLLLKHGANAKSRPNGFSSLSLALKANNEALIKLLRPYAEHEDEYYGLATYYWEKKEDASALEYTDKSLSLNPLNNRAWEIKGSIYISQKNLKGAETAYAKALEITLQDLKTDKSADNYIFAVHDAVLSGNYNEARRLGSDGLSYFPENNMLVMKMGHALLFLDNRKEALIYYKRSFKGFKQHEQFGQQAAQMHMNDFLQLRARYPEKIPLIEWAEKRLLEPFDFTYDEIPFGEDKAAVLGFVEGANVHKDETAMLGPVEPVLMAEFGEGLYVIDFKSQLNPMAVEKYAVTYGKWDTLEQVDLFLNVTPGQDWDRTLFLVSKHFKEQSGKLNDLFTAMQAVISKELKSRPVVHTTQNMSRSGPLPAKLAIWSLNNATVILDAFAVSSSTVQSQMIYVSKIGWGKYLNALRTKTQ